MIPRLQATFRHFQSRHFGPSSEKLLASLSRTMPSVIESLRDAGMPERPDAAELLWWLESELAVRENDLILRSPNLGLKALVRASSDLRLLTRAVRDLEAQGVTPLSPDWTRG